MQIDKTKKTSGDKKPKRKSAPSGPSLKISAFIELMRRLEVHKEQLSDEQVRFIQNAIQRFEYEAAGVVKTKLSLPKPKKNNASKPTSMMNTSPLPTEISGFIDRLVKMDSEEAALNMIRQLSEFDAERLAREQGLRAHSAEIARNKLAETVVTLRQIERIAGAGKSPH